MPSTVDASKVDASLHDGILHIQVEKRPEVKPRKIEIKAN
jgi:HSP20 family molecular chaperone IbpA